jgi:hypothetical protein
LSDERLLGMPLLGETYLGAPEAEGVDSMRFIVRFGLKDTERRVCSGFEEDVVVGSKGVVSAVEEDREAAIVVDGNGQARGWLVASSLCEMSENYWAAAIKRARFV